MKTALISVSDKNGLYEFATQLIELGFEIISTGGTKTYLEEKGLNIISVSDITNFPECLDGRVKTMHPKLLGGILAKKDDASHLKQVEEYDIKLIDLVCINLYPFKETLVNNPNSHETIIENIDIGGPTMLRSAAKNYLHTVVVTDIADYDKIISEYKTDGDISEYTRLLLAKKVFAHTASYDSLISNYLSTKLDESPLFGDLITLSFEKTEELRYGENSHQKGAFYKTILPAKGTLVNCNQLQGKALSYNNINDANAAIEIVKEFTEPAVVAIKHATPCGVATDTNVYDAYLKAYDSDPISIFGGIVATNREVDKALAEKMVEIFLEVVIATSYTEDALEVFKSKKNLRILQLDNINFLEKNEVVFKSVLGGLILQDYDSSSKDEYNVVTNTAPTEEEKENLLFAYKIVKHVKSNAIVLVKNKQTVGIGGGQTNRIGALKIALEMAGDKADGSVLGSDAFFPFNDCAMLAAQSGVKAIIQPGGSIKDQDSIDVCNDANIPMVFTTNRHFKH